MSNFKTAKILASALITTLGLTACIPTLIGGAALGAASGADRRTTGAQADDEIMELRIKTTALSALKHQSSNKAIVPQISVVSYNRHILLLGQVASEADKQIVERIARSENSAQAVYNYISLAENHRTLLNLSNDTLITSRIRANLLGANGIYAGHVKVVTYNGVTYAMGILTPSQQQTVTETIKTTYGVQKIVTLYQTINPSH